MERYAEWREGTRPRPFARFFLPLCFIGLLLPQIASSFGAYFLYSYIVFADMAALCALVYFDHRSIQKAVEPFRDLPAPVDQFAVSIVLSRRSETYGSDFGLVSVAGEWLIFERARCSFSLPAGSQKSRNDTDCLFEGPAGDHTVFFRATSKKKELLDCMDEWSRITPTGSSAPLPPVLPDEALSSANILRVVILLAAVIFAVKSVPYWGFFSFMVPIIGLVAYQIWDGVDERNRLVRSLPPRKASKKRSLPFARW